jgi:hypothetical protein
MSRWRLVPLLLLVMASCGGEEGFVAALPPAEPEALSQWWSRGGISAENPVTDQDLDVMRSLHPGESDEVLKEKIRLRRLLSRLAVERGLAEEPEVTLTFRRALARAFLRNRFEVELTPDSVPLKAWEDLYWEKSVRPHFDHWDVFFVLDIRFICCKGAAESCARDEVVQRCMAETEPDIREVHRILEARNPTDPEVLKKSVEELQVAGYPGLRKEEYSFQYDFTRPHEKQTEYNLVNRNVAQAVKDAPLNKVLAPVRSNFGWHILFVKEFRPAEHLAFGTPEVLERLQERFFELVRGRIVQQYLVETFKEGRIRVDRDALREVDWSRISGIE